MNLSPEFDSRFRKRKRRWNRFVAWLSAVVVFITTYVLILPALTAETELKCGLQEHEHTDACWAEVLEPELVGATCTAPHTHTASCRDADGNLICGYADFYLHIHNENCYNSAGELVCPLPEIREHTHTDGCYAADGTLLCGKIAAKEHTHTGGCYNAGKLVCGMQEVQVHTHDEACLQFEDVPKMVLICGEEEHTHDETCLLERQAAPEVEPYVHSHTDECYKDGALICTLTERTAEEAAAEVSADASAIDAMPEGDTPADGEADAAQRGSEQNPYTVEDYAEVISVVYPEGIETLLQSEDPFAENADISFTLTINNVDVFAGDSWFRYAIPFDWAAFDGATLTTAAESNAILVRGTEIGEWRLEDNAILCYFNEAADEYAAVSIEIPLTIRSALLAMSPMPLLAAPAPVRDGSEEAPFTIEDYGADNITVSYPTGILERLQSENPFTAGPSILFTVTIKNKDAFVSDSWFTYEIPFDWEAYRDATLTSGATSDLITAYNENLDRTSVLGTWSIDGHSILCHFNSTSDDFNLVSMDFTVIVNAGGGGGGEEEHFDANNALVRVEKLDSSTDAPLEGVVFAIYDENGNELVREATNANGIATFQLTNSGDFLTFYKAFYLEEIYDETSPAYLSNYIKDTRQRWFVSTADVIPSVRQAAMNKIMTEHPDVVQINQSDRDRYVIGEQAWIIYNSPYFVLPETGCHGLAWLISLAAALLTLGLFELVMRQKERRTYAL